MSNRNKVAALTAALALTVSAVPTLAQDDTMAAPEVPAAELDYQGEITMWNTMRDFELAEVQTLIEHARERVAERFGVVLETEVKLVAADGTYATVGPVSVPGSRPRPIRPVS